MEKRKQSVEGALKEMDPFRLRHENLPVMKFRQRPVPQLLAQGKQTMGYFSSTWNESP